MRNSVLLTIFIIFSVLSASKQNKRTVNVALETSLLFEPQDVRTNLGLVNNIKSFLDKISETLDPHAHLRYRESENQKTLPEFLNDLGSKFLNFSSDSIQRFTKVLKQHVHDYRSRARSSYHEIFSEPTLKEFLKNTVEQIFNMSGDKLKKKLHKFIRSDKPVLRSFTKRLNKFYSEEDLAKLYKFMKKLDKYVRKNKDMSKIIKDWLDFGIFDRYTKLNYTSKVKLLNDMSLLTDYFNGESRFRAEDEPFAKSVEEKSKKTIEKAKKREKKHQEDVSGSEGEDVHKHHRHSHAKDKHKNKTDYYKEKDGDPKQTEVIVDNVEFFIKAVDD